MANRQLFPEINSESTKLPSMVTSPSPPTKPTIPAVVRRDRRVAKIRSSPSNFALQEKLLPKRTPLSPPASVTPSPPTLQRSFSEPIDFSPTKPASLPPLPSLRRTSSSPMSCNQESPSSRRLKRMKETMEQMSHWCHQVISESAEEQETAAATDTKPNQEEEEEDRTEESVWVEEKPGGGLVVHFKCPCGKGYEILLSENKCYYKLM